MARHRVATRKIILSGHLFLFMGCSTLPAPTSSWPSVVRPVTRGARHAHASSKCEGGVSLRENGLAVSHVLAGEEQEEIEEERKIVPEVLCNKM